MLYWFFVLVFLFLYYLLRPWFWNFLTVYFFLMIFLIFVPEFFNFLFSFLLDLVLFCLFYFLLPLFCFVFVGTSELAFIVFHMIWNAVKDTQIRRAFSNSQGDDNSCRKKKKDSRILPRGPRKYFPLGSLIPGFEVS